MAVLPHPMDEGEGATEEDAYSGADPLWDLVCASMGSDCFVAPHDCAPNC